MLKHYFDCLYYMYLFITFLCCEINEICVKIDTHFDLFFEQKAS